MTKYFESKVGKKMAKTVFFLAKIDSKLLRVTSNPRKIFQIFLYSRHRKGFSFRSDKNAKFLAFQKEVEFFHVFLFHS